MALRKYASYVHEGRKMKKGVRSIQVTECAKLTIYKGDRHNDEKKADHLHFVVSDEVQFD